MELWIRSQDRHILEKINSIRIEKDEYWKILGYIPNGVFLLGEYKTKERALEILDEIEAVIKLKMSIVLEKEDAYKGFPDDVNEIKKVLNQMWVYEMPKE